MHTGSSLTAAVGEELVSEGIHIVKKQHHIYHWTTAHSFSMKKGYYSVYGVQCSVHLPQGLEISCGENCSKCQRDEQAETVQTH